MKIKKVFCLACIGLAGLVTFADPQIKNVTARQRFPWNGKVDISYEVVGTIPTENQPLSISVWDKTSGQVYTPSSSVLSGDAGAGEGVHNVVWDLSEQGIKIQSQNVVFTVEECPLYCVVDLSGGPSATSYPVTYSSSNPMLYFTGNNYKMEWLVLRKIPAGSFIMGSDQRNESHRVTLTKPFYIGVFEVTQKQWELVMGSNPSYYKGEMRPVECVYNTIRGSSGGAEWPSSSAVDSDSFLGRLRARTGLEFDLPTEAQWEYACRAGTTTVYSYGDSADESYMWYKQSGSSYTTHDVGTTWGSGNKWGLRDMHGNVWEWCLDWYGTLAYGTDPKGSSSGSGRVLRGGSWSSSADYCTSSSRINNGPSFGSSYFGFRLARTLSN